MKHHSRPYSWYIHPPALVRAQDAKYRDICTLCIGPTRFAFADPEWAAIAPVVTELQSPPCAGKALVDWMVHKLLIEEANRIRREFNLDLHGDFKTSLIIPQV